MATKQLASWAVSLHSSHLPSSVQQAALRSLYNYIGCTIGGSNHPTVLKAHSALSPFFGPSTTSLLGHGGSSTLEANRRKLQAFLSAQATSRARISLAMPMAAR